MPTTEQLAEEEPPNRNVEPRRGDRRALQLAIVLTALTATAVMVASAIALRDGAPRSGDWALIEMRVRSVGRAWPSVGAPSYTGTYHLGPLEYYVLAPFYRLLGQGPAALGYGAAMVNATAVAACAWLAWRRGRLAMVTLTLVALSTVAATVTAGFLADFWNPWVALFPSLAFLFAVWSVVEDDTAALPVLVLAGSWAAQAHFSYVVIVAPLSFAAVAVMAGRAWHRRRVIGHEPARPARARWILVALSSTLAAICWAPPAIEQIIHGSDGNLSATAARLLDPPQGTTTASNDVVGLAATELGVRSPALTGAEPIDVFTDNVQARSGLELLPPLVLVAAAVAVATRRRDGATIRFLAVAGAASTLAIVGISRLEPDRAFPHVLRFVWAADLFVLLAVAWCAVATLRGRRAVIDRVALGLGLTLVAVNLIRLTVGAGAVELPVNQSASQPALVACIDQLTETIRRSTPTSTVVRLETEELWPVAGAGIANELERSGATVALGPRMAFHAASNPDDTGGAPATTSDVVVVDESGLSTVTNRPGWQVLDICDPLSESERVELSAFPTRTNPTAEEIRRAAALHVRSSRFTLLERTT